LGASDAAFVAGLSTTNTDAGSHLPPIEDFLGRREDSSIAKTTVQSEENLEPEALGGADDLPPIEHFIDPLPEVDAFAPTDEQFYGAPASQFPDYPQRTDAATRAGNAEAEWVETDWQQYDWRSAAALGESGNADDEASVAWAATDWEARLPVSRAHPRGPADAIASALDEIAQRIRKGDLTLPSPGSVTDPAAIAATLAALLGVKR